MSTEAVQISCRGCLRKIGKTNEKIYLFDNFSDSIETLSEFSTISEMFAKYTSLDVNKFDEFSAYLCIQCFAKLKDFHEFRKICIASHFECLKQKSLNFDHTTVVGDNYGENVEIKQELNIVDDYDNSFSNDSNHFEKYSPHHGSDNEDVNTAESLLEETKEFTETVKKPYSTRNASKTKLKQKSELQNVISEDLNVENGIQNLTATVVPNTGIKCTMCDKVFFKQHRYDGHMRMHKGLKQFECDECGKEFCKWNSLKRHKSVRHVGEGETKAEFICGVNDCGKIYPLKESLKKHILIVHLNQRDVKKKDRKMVCEQCGKSFESISGLTRHSYTHSGEKPFKCHLCPKQYPTNYKLREHIMRHEGIKNHVCPTCGLRKTTMHELRVHMNYHTREKTFPCTMCTLVLPNSSRLNTHMKIVHYGIKEFHCNHCNRSFGKPDTLKHHIMTHTGERPHACSICDKRFIQPVALRTHMKTHTKIHKN